MAVINNLYPPIVDTYMPAFLIKDNSSSSVIEETVTYKIGSYSAIDSYNEAIDTYINNSSIDGVQELWNEYEIELAAIAAQYPDPTDPRRVEAERELKNSYDASLQILIAGSPYQNIIEEVFFESEPEEIEYREQTYTIKTLSNSTIDRNFICRVYFSLSLYNKIADIKNAQVTVRSQSTNQSALNLSKYPSGIILKQVHEDSTRDSSDKYYIEILPEDMENCNFIVDQYYKVQIRFTKSDTEDPIILDNTTEEPIDLYASDIALPLDEWLNRNLNNFSEWSTVCLIRGISVPSLSIDGFVNSEQGQPFDIQDNVANGRLVGRLTFADENETETLRSFRIKLYDANNPSNLKLIYQTEEQYQNIFTDKNSFDYSLNYWFQVDNSYKMVFSYTTQNLFQKDEEYIFNVISAGIDPLNIIVEAYTDEENGRIKLSLNRPSSMGSFTGQIIIKRTSNKSNYTKWEDMYTTNYQNVTGISYDWYDYTIENGIWYVYAIQGVDEDGLYTPISVLNDPVMLSFEYIFLTSKNKQLKIAYNPSISSFKHTLSESRQDTIGGKYPFIKRNGYIDYVQFPLGGMIYSAMDENGTLTTKEEVFGKWIDFYTAYNEINNIPTWNDLIWEKNFRDKVIDFLYDDSAKLFRSPTEGNYLIKLMDIQFQPNQALGRQLWSFTANAFEIDECNIQNYEKYNIVEVNDGNTFIGNGTDAVFPITRIFYVQSQEEFPVEGVLGCLYIYDKQIYLWNNNSHNYELISVPTWNGTTDFNSLSGTNGQLYTNGIDLYTWNSNTFSFDGISVPRYNNSLQGEIDPPSSL